MKGQEAGMNMSESKSEGAGEEGRSEEVGSRSDKREE